MSLASQPIVVPMSETAARALRLTWAVDLVDDGDYEPQLVDGLLDRNGKAMIVGPSGSGKSTLAIDLACAIGTGRAWNGRTTLPGVALIVAAEAPEGVRRRIKAYSKQRDTPLTSIHVAILEQALSFDTAAVEDLVDQIRTEADRRKLPVRLVLVDTLAANEPGKEDADHFGRVTAALAKLSSELDCMAVVVHHTGKVAEAGARGHSSLYAAMDTVIEVTVDGPVRSAKLAKQRDGASGEAFAFRLEPVGIGFRKTANPLIRDTVTACAVIHEGAAPSRIKPPREGHQTRAVDALRLDMQSSQRTRWTFHEACEVIRSHHERVVGDLEKLHRNTPRKTLNALGRSGHVLIVDGFVTLQEYP